MAKAKKSVSKKLDMNLISKALETVMKRHGKDKIGLIKASDLVYNFIPTSIDVLDAAIGGGILLGGTTLIYGPWSSGKTTLAMRVIAEAQKKGLICLWVSAEPFSTDWAKKNGIDLDNLIVIRGETLDTNAEVFATLIAEKSVDVIVYDSIGAVAPKGEKYEKDGSYREIGSDTIGVMARQLSKLNRLIATDIIRNNVSLIFISQVRTNVNITGRSSQKAQGGNSVYHAASLILRVKEDKFHGESDNNGLLLWPIHIRIDKNHITGVEQKSLVVYTKRDVGPSNFLTTLTYAKDNGIIIRNGPYYSFGGIKIQGWLSFMAEVETNLDLYNDIVSKIQEEEIIGGTKSEKE